VKLGLEIRNNCGGKAVGALEPIELSLSALDELNPLNKFIWLGEGAD
jgi:hypothetical protein